jgi:phage tail-like protein
MAKKNLPGPDADGVNKPPGTKGSIPKVPTEKKNQKGKFDKVPTEKKNQKGKFDKVPTQKVNKVGSLDNIPTQKVNKVGKFDNVPTEKVNKVGKFDNVPTQKVNKIGEFNNIPTQKINKIGDLSSSPTQKINKVGSFKNIKTQQINEIGSLNSGDDYNQWPLPKFSFWVDIGGFDGRIAFQGMDGLGASVAKMEFRDGNSSKFYKQSRPTLTSFDPCTLKKGMFTGDAKLFNWFSNVSSGALFSDMRTVSITLCVLEGGKQKDIFTWTLEKAYVTKYTPSNMDAESDSEPAIEEVELSYQAFSTGI